jgi:hypothetical protein
MYRNLGMNVSSPLPAKARSWAAKRSVSSPTNTSAICAYERVYFRRVSIMRSYERIPDGVA